VPKVFLARWEEDGFLERSGLKSIEVVTYTDGGDLMGKVTSAIRSLRARRVGMVFGVERDSYILFYEMFKRANRDVEVVDVGDLLMEMRAVKDGYEVEAITKAAEVSSRVLERALDAVKEGVSELDIAAEAYSLAFKLGSEEPHIYVNVGPHPRVHAEPLRDSVVRDGVLVTLVVGADFRGYYANTSVSTFVGSSMPDEIKKPLPVL
jgi:Xaa-Pro aminopeptidase